MAELKLPKRVVDKIGRIFVMFFNRALMYNMNHPFTTQSMADFCNAIQPELKNISPIVIIMHNDSFFIEDEPIDPRVNVGKLLFHFKKTGIRSVSFENGLDLDNLSKFFTIIVDSSKYPNAEKIKEACERENVVSLKVNHVFFKKVTEDDEIISSQEVRNLAELKQTEKHKSLKSDLLEMISGGLALDELGQALSLSSFLQKPEIVSEYVNTPDNFLSEDPGSSSQGEMMFEHIHKIRLEVDKVSSEVKGSKLHELAESVAKMRDELIRGIIERKEKGLIYDNEGKILSEAKELTDKVLLELVRDEYKQGATSINRLAHILRRLIPDNDELQRFLPKLKETLLLEGMSLADFLKLTEELEAEISSQGISNAIKKSAEKIGVSGEDLLKEITSDPQQAAELIYLATELRKETGDKSALTGILVDYIERITGNAALDSNKDEGEFEKDHLKSVVSEVESEILERLKLKNVNPDIMADVAEQLNSRLDQFIEKLESNFIKRQDSDVMLSRETASLYRLMENEFGDNNEFRNLLLKIRNAFLDKKAKGDIFDSIRFETDDNKDGEEQDRVEQDKGFQLPKKVHARKSFLFFVEQEILRASRYMTPFSLITFSILRALPQNKYVAGTINKNDVIYNVLEILSDVIRETDIVGVLDKKKIVALLPMSNEDEARLALRRLSRHFQLNMIKVNDIHFEIRIAGAVTVFNKDITPNLKELIRKAEHDIFDMVQRVRNIQSLY